MSLKTKLRPALLTATCFGLSAGLVVPTATADEQTSVAQDDQLPTFEEGLREKAASDPEAAENLKKFESLSEDQQETIETVIQDGTAARELADTVDSSATELSEDTPSVQRETPEGITTQATYDVSGTYTYSQQILGVTVTKLNQDFRWRTGNNQVLSTTNCTASATNYNVVINITEDTSHYVSAGHGFCETVWHGNVIHEGLNVRLDKIQLFEVSGAGIVNRSTRNA